MRVVYDELIIIGNPPFKVTPVGEWYDKIVRTPQCTGCLPNLIFRWIGEVPLDRTDPKAWQFAPAHDSDCSVYLSICRESGVDPDDESNFEPLGDLPEIESP